METSFNYHKLDKDYMFFLLKIFKKANNYLFSNIFCSIYKQFFYQDKKIKNNVNKNNLAKTRLTYQIF